MKKLLILSALLIIPAIAVSDSEKIYRADVQQDFVLNGDDFYPSKRLSYMEHTTGGSKVRCVVASHYSNKAIAISCDWSEFQGNKP